MSTVSPIGKEMTAKVVLHNYRFPKDKAPVPGAFAIVCLDVVEVISGNIPADCFASNGTIAVTGEMPTFEEGMEYFLTATLTRDPKWGLQYTHPQVRLAYDMSDRKDQEKFLSFFMTENQIKSLFYSYENPIELLEKKDIEALTQIKGIGPYTANKMCIKYAANINNGRAYVELKELGLTKSAIDKLIKQFGSPDLVIDIIKKNPYSLINLVTGYGWERADKIALAQGFSRGCKERCLAYTHYKLGKVANEDGNSKIDLGELMADVAEQCAPTDKQTLANWIKEQTIEAAECEQWEAGLPTERDWTTPPVFYYDKASRFFGLYKYRSLEKKIAYELQRIKNAPNKTTFDRKTCEQIIQATEAEQGFVYTSEQKKAIWSIIDSNVAILTGSAGTGKSSSLRPLVKIFQHYNYRVAQCALSGRASSLLTEYTGVAGKTIHRLLHYLPDLERFDHNKSNPLTEDVIILDEASMVGEELFYSLISSIRSGCKLLMLGDIKQLPPIAVGNLLQDSIASGYVPTTTLTVVQRQALRSGIISQSVEVCKGAKLIPANYIGEEVRGELQDFKIITCDDAGLAHAKVIKEFKRLYSEKGISSDDIQIVVPVRTKGMNSCRFFNAEIQAIVNGSPETKGVPVEVWDGNQKFEVTYKQGDRIMVTKNNYHARNLYGGETAIFNGNLGHIKDIDKESMLIALNDGNEVVIPRDEWNNVTHSWAATCHKLQGAQAPYVIVSLDNSAYPLLMREWLYTALTRARKYCTLIGQPNAINTATRVSNIKIKKTWLKEDLYNLYMDEQKGA